MNIKKSLVLLLLLLNSCFSFSQTLEEKPLQLKPYIGFSAPLGDFKEYSDSGFAYGLTLEKYLNSNFALGLDLGFQNNAFKKPFDFSNISAPYNLRENNSGSWNATSLVFGPTYKFGSGAFSTEIFAKAGFLYLKTPEYKTEIISSDFSKTIFELPSQERTGFAFITGFRFNYKLSKSISLFLNPQYVYASSKIDYCNCGVEAAFSNGTFNPDLLLDNKSIKETIEPSYLNLNAGVSWNFGTTKKDVADENNGINRNLPGCTERLQGTVECTSGGPQVYILSEWWGQNPNNFLSVSVYDGNTLVFSGTSISNNNMTLGAPLSNRPHHFVANGYEGRTLRVEISIDDQFGALSCYKNDLIINIPDCQYVATCGWDYTVGCNSTTNANKITISNTWGNVPAGSTLNFTVLDPLSNPITYTSNPNNLPQSISGNGTATHELFVSGYSGMTLGLKMEILDSSGNIICSQTTDILMSPCNFRECGIEKNIAKCENGNVYVDFSIDWANYTNFSQYAIYIEILDNNNSPIPHNFLPYTLTGISGSGSYNMFLPSQYAGTTITVQSRICELGGIKSCCYKRLQIEIPVCCEVCTDVVIKDVTNPQPTNGQNMFLMGNITSPLSNPITKVIAQLESYSANNISGITLPNPNFEFQSTSQINGSLASFIGSLTGDRGNMLVQNISPSSGNVNYKLPVDGNTNKLLTHYSVKFTIFRQDGTYCEKTINYTR